MKESLSIPDQIENIYSSSRNVIDFTKSVLNAHLSQHDYLATLYITIKKNEELENQITVAKSKREHLAPLDRPKKTLRMLRDQFETEYANQSYSFKRNSRTGEYIYVPTAYSWRAYKISAKANGVLEDNTDIGPEGDRPLIGEKMLIDAKYRRIPQ
jgi:hypothetical protein